MSLTNELTDRLLPNVLLAEGRLCPPAGISEEESENEWGHDTKHRTANDGVGRVGSNVKVTSQSPDWRPTTNWSTVFI